ncbi:membrane protein [Betaproteobacteria bacterium]|nr:membrane protein [Betaproteobacteria bacterium]
MQQAITVLCVAMTLGIYIVILGLYKKYRHPLLNVIALCATLIIVFLVLCGLSWQDYAPAKDIMTFLLGPATMVLAVPLYRYRALMRRCAFPIVLGIASGAFVTMVSAGLIARLGGLPEEVVMSIIPKGVSIPFAVGISGVLQGIPALTAAFVVATGVFGALVMPWTMTKSGIHSPVARGLCLGTVAHGQGILTALEEGELQGGMAGLAMILAGIFTALTAPWVVQLLHWVAWS